MAIGEDLVLARMYCEELIGLDPCAGIEAATQVVYSEADAREALESAKAALELIIDRATKGRQKVCDALAKLPQQDPDPILGDDPPPLDPDPDSSGPTPIP